MLSLCMKMLGKILSLVTRLVDHFVLYHPQIIPVLVAQSVVSKSVQSSKNVAQTQIILEYSSNSEHTISVHFIYNHLGDSLIPYSKN